MSPVHRIEDYLAKQILSPQGYAQYRTGDVSKSELAPFIREIAAISQSYVTHSVGNKLASPIPTITAAEAYALYYTIINAAKILHLTPLLSLEQREISVLDIGCGPGTAGLALLTALDKKVHMTCVEHSSPMRTVAQRLLSQYRDTGTLESLSILSGIHPQVATSFDLVIAANVLAELDADEGERVIQDLAQRVSEGGYLIVLEPGQQLHTRRLMTLRNQLIQAMPAMTPQFPCTRADHCPMLAASPTDWCHGAIEWQQPPLNAQLDDLLSFNKHRIKYSAFIFQKGGTLPEGVRVITPPQKTRAGVETTICGNNLYGIARIRKGMRSENNRALEKSDVFDRLLMSKSCVGDIPEGVVITSCS